MIQSLSLNVEPGTIMGLLGPSGCGKTTLLRAIAGLEVPTTGTVGLGSADLFSKDVNVSPAKRRIGMVFQDWALFPSMSVEANVAFGVAKSVHDRPALVKETLEMVGLDNLGSRMPDTLSGGQQQRVAIARAIAQQPDLLLLDEPFSNLDATLRTTVRTEVHRLLGDLGITTVLVTHDQQEAFVLSSCVAVMNDGKIRQVGPPEQLYNEPADEWVAGFVGEVVLVPGIADGATAGTALGDLSIAKSQQGLVNVAVRPEQLEVRLADSVAPQAGGVSGTVYMVEFKGPTTTVFVECLGAVSGEGLSLQTRHDGPPRFAAGDTVWVSVVADGLPAFADPAAPA